MFVCVTVVAVLEGLVGLFFGFFGWGVLVVLFWGFFGGVVDAEMHKFVSYLVFPQTWKTHVFLLLTEPLLIDHFTLINFTYKVALKMSCKAHCNV